ncbi:hypothetical protein Pan241w_53210 [Gimesia alba]|uniref:Uncharacterized protein n=1 Tax=Gimesia alba TaxID=2527973 RepID=A0A517RN12_9PLAN|nr:hypothetical protein [Gimesia alba]QDT45202.1 hypothetical protein Pan241w_53210 [Gimesia alba]
MGKRFEIDRQTTVRETPDASGVEIIIGLAFWIILIGVIAKGCGG